MAKVAFELLHVDRLPNYRRTMGPVNELAKSIGAEGLQVPLVVRAVRDRSKEGEGKTTYDVVDGRRRYDAIARIREDDKKAFTEVEVKLFEGNEADALIMAFVCNAERHDHSPLDQADFLRMMTGRGHKLGDVAKRCGITAPWAGRVLAARNGLEPRVLKAIDDRKLSFSLAEMWLVCSPKQQNVELDKYLEALGAGGKGKKKAANKAVGAARVMGFKPLSLMFELVEARTEKSDYDKGLGDGLAIALCRKDPPKDLLKAAEEAKKRLRQLSPRKGKRG